MDAIIRFFQEGGAFMYPIAIVMAIGLAIALERLLFLLKEKSSNRRAFDEMLPMLQKRDMRAALNYANNSDSKISRIFSAAIARIPGSQRREEIEYALEEGLMEAIPQLEKRTQYVATLANIATLMGLLGTIMGLIAAFTAVANAAPAEKAALLSQSISVAMNTTAFGLMAAIPLILLHSYLQSKTSEIVDSIEMAGVKFLNIITERKAGQTTSSN
ncbi:MotA/TolQ/ExbB proton channel family protein [Venatoribacter cucullus]|uniref:MotA/TolQ/ExbB proton channel family protein n=1 Tax=Venatoribacter cucullus TaxID=2661630 RepID=A0A9E8FKK4_9GAMM|nr:MotA/TolQ/ExbB proton channel family protein [Venatoribacter cucullus]QQD21544.1 MotA/TolQ/ExbB proton channel family protein [Oceanospirillaceae bacterium ASx5O]QQD24221.1 MotA/TolQ/ExbB proton channel family protein [Venatoribacter cucullus]UZK03592.1 MotA/TolQ/ExbB proton channel family protein [Venatoribacter cucullus]